MNNSNRPTLSTEILGTTMLPERTKEQHQQFKTLIEQFKTADDFLKWMREKEKE